MKLKLGFASAAVMSAALVLNLSSALNAKTPAVQYKLSMSVQSADGSKSVKGVESPNSVSLSYDADLYQGGTMTMTGAKAVIVRLDPALAECTVFMDSGKGTFTIPDAQSRRVYPPESFTGIREAHIRAASDADLAKYRNLALNPYYARGITGFYPAASSNSECRDEFAFRARNAIDGFNKNNGHGYWPFQSWGPDQRKDLWWRLDFGRMVEIDKLALYIRADFPHDKYWKQAVLTFSDGSTMPIELTSNPGPQEIKFPKKTTNSLLISGLVQDEPLGWCGFTEVEVWGRDVIGKRKSARPVK